MAKLDHSSFHAAPTTATHNEARMHHVRGPASLTTRVRMPTPPIAKPMD